MGLEAETCHWNSPKCALSLVTGAEEAALYSGLDGAASTWFDKPERRRGEDSNSMYLASSFSPDPTAAAVAPSSERPETVPGGSEYWPRNVSGTEAGTRGARGRDRPPRLGVQPQRSLFCGSGKSPGSAGIPRTGVKHGCATFQLSDFSQRKWEVIHWVPEGASPCVHAGAWLSDPKACLPM